MATTGSSLEAEYAGINPDTNPMITDTNIPVKIFVALRAILKSSP
jgi:hypothetical protein